MSPLLLEGEAGGLPVLLYLGARLRDSAGWGSLTSPRVQGTVWSAEALHVCTLIPRSQQPCEGGKQMLSCYHDDHLSVS